MKQLKAIKGHTYANKFQKAGDVYSASDADAKLMVLVKNSTYYVEPVVVEEPQEETKAEEPKPKRPYVRKNQTASKPAGNYSRKDMKAE